MVSARRMEGRLRSQKSPTRTPLANVGNKKKSPSPKKKSQRNNSSENEPSLQAKKLMETVNKNYNKSKKEGKIKMNPLQTHQGNESTNGCTVISALMVCNHLKSSKALSDDDITKIIDEESPKHLAATRASKKIPTGKNVSIFDATDYLINVGILTVPMVGVINGNMFDESDVRKLMRLLESAKYDEERATRATMNAKTGAVLYFREHYISILKVDLGDGLFAYDIIESLAFQSTGLGVRIRCETVQEVVAALRWYGLQRYTTSEYSSLDKTFQEVTFDLDMNEMTERRLFQGYVFREDKSGVNGDDGGLSNGSNGGDCDGDGNLSSLMHQNDGDHEGGKSKGANDSPLDSTDEEHPIKSLTADGGSNQGDTQDEQSTLSQENQAEATKKTCDFASGGKCRKKGSYPSCSCNKCKNHCECGAKERDKGNTQRRAGKATVACTYSTGGSCVSNGTYNAWGCTCNKCKRHCQCGAKERAKAQESEEAAATHAARQKRPNREEVNERISVAAVDMTPARIKSSDPDYRSWKDFYQLMPPRQEVIAHLHDSFRIGIASGASSWSKLRQYAIDLLLLLATTVAQLGQVHDVQNRLLYEVTMSSNGKRDQTILDKKKDDLMQSMVEIEMQPAVTDNNRVVRSLLTHHFSATQLETVQTELGIDPEKQVAYGEKARKKGREDYKKFTGIASETKSDSLDADINEIEQQGRVSDDVVLDFVEFLVDRCQILSWGLKTVPLGDGETTLIPNLIRMYGIEELWNQYVEAKAKEKLRFEAILDVEGPLRPGHANYKGSSYNVLMKWCESPPTWEPLYDVSLDDPVSLAMYGFQNALLEKKGWVHLERYVKRDGSGRKEQTFTAFQGGRKMIGRTLFFEAMRSLTGGGDVLVTAVDYVKGSLVHDVCEILQRIINDHIKVADGKLHSELTKDLSLVSNFLKNLYKEHVGDDDECVEWTSHSISRGLGVADSSARPKHYSSMDLSELKNLVNDRDIDMSGRTKAARSHIYALMDDDHSKETAPESDDDDGTLPEVNDLLSAETLNDVMDRLEGMTRTELESEIRRYKLKPRSRRITDAVLRKVLRDYITPLLNDEQDEGDPESPLTLRTCFDDEDDTPILGRRPRTGDVDASGNGSNKPDDDHSSHDNGGTDSNENSKAVDDSCPDDWCDGCAFLHYFMLEKLPKALRSVAQTDNLESIDNALEYITDAHEKFMLYQGHVVRVVNQNRNLQKHREALRELCCKEKNTVPLHLWHVIDFKMKWEAMYQRETTVKNYGKRGISWHGNRIESYVWDEEKQEPVRVVVKLDQILDGWNKQDGMTVLALVEAAQVFVHRHFPGATIDFLQSDNAAAYHLKELVLGIPKLNARMRKIGGPQIKNIVRTETQDGKSLLDAHFAHATALVKRWLREITQNMYKQAASPDDLVRALSANGGLQNCGVQLVNFDSDVKKSLDKLAELLGPASEKLKEYFSRCNEINYFVDDDSDDGHCFQLRATAYSGVGSGALFEIDIENGTVKVIGEGNVSQKAEDKDESSLDPDDSDDGGVDSDDVSYGEIIEDERSDEDGRINCQDEMYLLEAIDAVDPVSIDKELKSANGIPHHSSLEMVTGVKIEKCMGLGEVLHSRASTTRLVKRRSAISVMVKGRMTFLLQAIKVIKSERFESFGIYDGKDQDVKEFRAARNYVVPEEYRNLPQGWARRRERGSMYGRKYIVKYKALLYKWFKEGSDNSEMKIGPSIMTERLRSMHPNMYTLPSFTEVQAYITQLFSKEKKGENAAPPPVDDDDDEAEVDVENEEEEMFAKAAVAVVDFYGGTILPLFVHYHLELRHGKAAVEKNKKVIKKALDKRRKMWMNKAKKELIG